jgi:LmbE family N-acetylglucosaminyl deacetylase
MNTLPRVAGYFRSLPTLLAAMLLVCVSLQADPRTPATPLTGAPELRETLDSLNTLGSMLMLGAHPDDENTGVIAYFARGRHVRAAYLSATRGEGGQNLIGTEQGALMGLIRTQELLEARRIDGGEQFFTRSIDFGFSKAPEEAFEKWGREILLEDIVRVIRSFRPDVVVSRFPPPPGSGGHGQHTAVGHIAAEAFEAAADPSRFPEQIAQGLQPWRAVRLVWNTFNFSPAQERDEEKRTDRLKLEIGDYDPLLGKSYVEIAGESRSMHRSQSMGTNQRKGAASVFFGHVAGTPASDDLFDGVDTSWSRVRGGETVGHLLAHARDLYQAERPAAILPSLVKAYAELEKLNGPWIALKRADLLHAIQLAAGLWMDAAAQRWDATPGSELAIGLEVINRSDFPLRWKRTEIRGVVSQDVDGPAGDLPYNQMTEKSATVSIPGGASYSQPYWLREPSDSGRYRVNQAQWIGRPENPPVLEATFYFETADGVELAFPAPVVYRWVDRAYGERVRSLEIVPPVAVSFTRPSLIFAEPAAKTVAVRLRGNAASEKTPQTGTVTLEAPPGWRVSPASAPFEIARRGQDLTVTFELTPPAQDGGGTLAAKVQTAGATIDRGMQQIEYDHIPVQMVYPEAAMRVERVNLKLLSKNIGYVTGAGDNIPEALEEIGAATTLLSETDLASGDLSRFDAIVTGVRALNTRPDLLAARERLLDYVERGGTLVVQYNTLPGFGRGRRGDVPEISPYPMTPSRERVTDENAAVTFPIPGHPLLQAPNQITAKDFEGWIQERGLYFMDEWDEHYDAVLASNDPGEQPQRGGLLYTRHGKGVFIFTGYAWFRQLPAGVPGAYRVFANLVSAGKVK